MQDSSIVVIDSFAGDRQTTSATGSGGGPAPTVSQSATMPPQASIARSVTVVVEEGSSSLSFASGCRSASTGVAEESPL
jgi:hypothetical protein